PVSRSYPFRQLSDIRHVREVAGVGRYVDPGRSKLARARANLVVAAGRDEHGVSALAELRGYDLTDLPFGAHASDERQHRRTSVEGEACQALACNRQAGTTE